MSAATPSEFICPDCGADRLNQTYLDMHRLYRCPAKRAKKGKLMPTPPTPAEDPLGTEPVTPDEEVVVAVAAPAEPPASASDTTMFVFALADEGPPPPRRGTGPGRRSVWTDRLLPAFANPGHWVHGQIPNGSTSVVANLKKNPHYLPGGGPIEQWEIQLRHDADTTIMWVKYEPAP